MALQREGVPEMGLYWFPFRPAADSSRTILAATSDASFDRGRSGLSTGVPIEVAGECEVRNLQVRCSGEGVERGIGHVQG